MTVYVRPGVEVDKKRSNEKSVTLRNLQQKTTGRYRCEVSTEGPTFATESKYGDLLVVGKAHSVWKLQKSFVEHCKRNEGFKMTFARYARIDDVSEWDQSVKSNLHNWLLLEGITSRSLPSSCSFSVSVYKCSIGAWIKSVSVVRLRRTFLLREAPKRRNRMQRSIWCHDRLLSSFLGD